jgi:two-component system cell cycle response regulator
VTPTTPQRDAAVVVVGDSTAGRDLFERLHRPVVCVDNYLEALGELSHRSVHAVVGRVDPMRRSVEATVTALRQLSPHGRLLLLAHAGDEPDAMRAVRFGFDDYLVGPLRAGELAEAVEAAPLDQVEAPAELPDESPAPSPEAGGDESLSLAALKAGTTSDLALVEKLLTRRGEMRDLAVRVVQREVGCDDVRWAAEPALDAQACVDITYDEEQLGYLVSEHCTDQQLAEWADWLARWLALEARITHLNHLALHDELTGVWNRRYFDRFLDSVLRRAREQRFRVTVLIFDIDDFKKYNDKYGHAAGDEILRQTSRLMQSLVRKHDVVARIGGDEFGVIFWDAERPRRTHSEHPQSISTVADRFQKAVCQQKFPQLADLAPGTLTISGGLASFPWDGATSDELVKLADSMLLQSKGQGKNKITFGPGAMKACRLAGLNPES